MMKFSLRHRQENSIMKSKTIWKVESVGVQPGIKEVNSQQGCKQASIRFLCFNTMTG